MTREISLVVPRSSHQRVSVIPATEADRANHKRRATYEPSGAPMRCQLWDHRRLVAVVPVTFNDMGHPTDVVYNPPEIERITRIAFIYGGVVYAYPLGETMTIKPGNPLHLALGHLKLMDKFGRNALRAGA